ncbi:radical SAM protein [Candidatus Aerophobetes bacterium]|nr:radical SAM protein [Candidatus Aerophobetes bacterium]
MDLSYLVGFFLKNRVNRIVFSYLARKNKNGKSILENLLIFYTNQHPLRITTRLKLFPFYLFFEIGRFCLNQTKQEAKQKLSDPIFQHGIALTMRSVGKYGMRKPQIFSAPPVVVWNFTNACNLKCRHCYQDAGKKLQQELPLTKRLDIVDQLAREDVFSIAYSGGEPLMDKEIWKAIERGSKYNLYQSIATNGTLITPDVVKKMVDVGLNYVEISLDSTKPEVYDNFRGVPGLWKRAVEGIENVVAEQKLKVGIASTVTKYNFDELEELIQFSKNIGADKFYAFNFIPIGRGKNIVDADLTPEQREKMLNILYEHYKKEHFVCMTTAPQYARVCMMRSSSGEVPTSHYTDARGKKARVLAEFIGGCGVGRAYCSIQPDGIVTPCVFMPIPVGDLKLKSFAEIWNTSPILKELRVREDLEGHCGVCDYRAACGGCRARAYGYFGNYKAPDPGCINNKDVFLELKSRQGEGAKLTNM